MTMYCCCTTPIILLIVVYFGVAWCPNYCNAYATTSVNTVNQQLQQQQNVDVCNPDRLAVYKVVLHTYWTRELFPKHYPDWRPPAQWTKTFGRSHDESFNLYRIGRTASPGMKLFVETGRSDTLDGQFTKEGSIFDEFTIPAIPNGSGRSEIKFFVDGNHTMVSLMTRIVPSPDWFIGVDSFQLCVGGSWIDTVTVELDPLDAGTDNGFTFTAPNWPTDPQGIIYRITSRYPSHPAGSFFYPQNKRLPPIATVQFIKLKEYELSEVFHYAEDDRKYETISTKTHLEMEHNQIDMNNELSATIEQERQHEMTQRPSIFTEKDKIRAKLLAKMNPITNTTQSSSSISSTIIQQYQPSLSLSPLLPISSPQPSLSSSSSSSALSPIHHQYILPKNNKDAILNNIARTYASKSTKKHKKQRHLRPPKDCRVGHWSDWSACSKTCGIGEMHRYRKVIKHSKRGGRPCPPLQESKWCGSAKDCNSPSGYFKW